MILPKESQFEELEVKNVILATGMRNNNKLFETLRANKVAKEICAVDGCNFRRTVRYAMEQAAFAARTV